MKILVSIIIICYLSSYIFKQVILSYKKQRVNLIPTTQKDLIILGAAVIDEKPTLMLKTRLDLAIDYLLVNPQTKCIVSGANVKDRTITEADVMQKYLLAHGIDKKRIIKEDQARNSKENLHNCAKLVNFKKCYILTNQFHILRIAYLCKKINWDVGFVIASNQRFKRSIDREILAWIKMLIFEII